MLASPRKRIWPSAKPNTREKVSRQDPGLKSGKSPSNTSIQASPDHKPSHIHCPNMADYFLGDEAAGEPTEPPPRMALKNSMLGSITITSDFCRKVAL